MAKFIIYDSPYALISPDKETINGIEAAIRWAESEVPQNLRSAMDRLVYAMALVNQGYSRKMSFGPLDPGGKRSELSWQLPVRRITQSYYLGWKLRRISPAVYQVYNDSREAYFIEFGINWRGEGRRVRRPVRKLALRQMMTYMASTQAYHRMWVDVFKSRKHHAGFTQIIQSPGLGGMGSMKFGRRLP